MNKLLIYLLFLTTFFTKATAQENSEYAILHYNTENSLPSNGIKGMEWDKANGFLWIATEAGLVRFNGLNFKIFNKKNTDLIKTERLIFLTKNLKNEIYTSDLEGNIIKIKKNKLELFASIDIQTNTQKNKLFALSVSEKLFSKDIEFKKYKPVFFRFEKVIPINDTSCYILQENKIGYYSFSMPEPQIVSNISSIKSVFAIKNQIFFIDESKRILQLKTEQQLQPTAINFFDKKGNSITENTPNANFFWQNNGDAIAVVEHKAYLLSLQNNKIEAHLVCDAIPAKLGIYSIIYDSVSKSIFLGTMAEGIYIISNKILINKLANENKNSYYYSQVELPNGNILTNKGEIVKVNNIAEQLPIKAAFDFTVVKEEDSLLWYHAKLNEKKSGLHRYNFKTKNTTTFPKIRSSNLFALKRINGKIFYADMLGIGLLEQDTIRYFYKNTREDNYGDEPYDMVHQAENKIALATCNNLLLIDINNFTVDTLLSLKDNCIRALWKYKEYLFIGTYGKGFYIYNNVQIKSIPVDVNKYLLYTHCFLPDSFGFVWLSTNRGIFKAKIEDLLTSFNDTQSKQVYYHYFGKDDGMLTTEMNGGCKPCAIQLKNKTLSFPSMQGLVWANPSDTTLAMPIGEVFIDEIHADGNEIKNLEKNLKHISYQTNELIFNLSYPAWCKKENIYLDYSIAHSKSSTTWKPVLLNNGTAISIINLTPGDYTLTIRKLNGFGVDNYSYTTIHFAITTPWYNTFWFYTFIAILAYFFVFVVVKFFTYRYQVNQRKLEAQIFDKTKELQQKNEILEKNNTIKTRLISIISHDIITPLKFVVVAGKNLLEKKTLMSEELQNETLQEITNTSNELQLLSTNILNWIKYQNENRRLAKEEINIREIVSQVFTVVKPMAKKANLQLVNNIAENIIIHQYQEPLRITLYNIILNAINFSDKGSITVNATPAEKEITLSITDEGKGMTQEQVNNIIGDTFIITSTNIDNKKGNGLGYLIIKDLLKTLNGKISIASKKNEGTVITIHLQL